MKSRTAIALALFVAFSGQLAAAENARTIIVMDGSGSMWGQIEGKPKLEIARDTVAEVLRDFPKGRSLGLLAYGHRKRGDCSDIELLVPPQAGAEARVLDAVRNMRFQGKTPLTEAVRQAANSLRYTEEPATVVLVTDGIETCSADPCALATELEGAGIDFTAHVVGFGLTKAEGASISCLAERTGGKYIDAKDGNGLRDALSETIVAKSEPVVANDVAEAPPPSLPPATLEATPQAGRTSTIEVTWTGPAAEGDTIDIVPFDGKGAHALDYANVSSGVPVQLHMPAELGNYVLRYRWKGEKEVFTLTTQPIEIVDVDVFLDAPTSAGQGAIIDVKWGGPGGENDYVSLTPKGEDLIDAWAAAADLGEEGNPTHLQVPLTPGEYTMRYIARGASDWDILLEKPFMVVPFQVHLSAPDIVHPNTRFQVDWHGPAAHRDWIDIVPAGDMTNGQELDSFYAERLEGEDAIYTLLAPEEPGAYEIRYVATHPGRGEQVKILHRIPIHVSAEIPVADE